MRNSNTVSHNACSVYDYNKLRWNVQPHDIVRFYDGEGSFTNGEVVFLTSELMDIRRLDDGRIYVVTLFDLSYWQVRINSDVRRLPNGIFFVGDIVCLDGELNLPDEKYVICKFENGRVKVHYSVKGRSVGWYFVREGEILKKIYSNPKQKKG